MPLSFKAKIHAPPSSVADPAAIVTALGSNNANKPAAEVSVASHKQFRDTRAHLDSVPNCQFSPFSSRKSAQPFHLLPYPDRFEISESVLLKDVLLAFQGITGRHIYYDGEIEAYAVKPELGVPAPTRSLVCKLTELGWLYNQLQRYCETCRADLTYGLSGQVSV